MAPDRAQALLSTEPPSTPKLRVTGSKPEGAPQNQQLPGNEIATAEDARREEAAMATWKVETTTETVRRPGGPRDTGFQICDGTSVISFAFGSEPQSQKAEAAMRNIIALHPKISVQLVPGLASAWRSAPHLPRCRRHSAGVAPSRRSTAAAMRQSSEAHTLSSAPAGRTILAVRPIRASGTANRITTCATRRLNGQTYTPLSMIA